VRSARSAQSRRAALRSQGRRCQCPTRCRRTRVPMTLWCSGQDRRTEGQSRAACADGRAVNGRSDQKERRVRFGLRTGGRHLDGI
jgi:hypothetical protein